MQKILIGENSTTSNPITFLPLIKLFINCKLSLNPRPSGTGVPVAGIIEGSNPSTSKVIYMFCGKFLGNLNLCYF